MTNTLTAINLGDESGEWIISPVPCQKHGQHFAYTNYEAGISLVSETAYPVIGLIAALAQAVTRQTGVDALAEAARINALTPQVVNLPNDLIGMIYQRIRENEQ